MLLDVKDRQEVVSQTEVTLAEVQYFLHPNFSKEHIINEIISKSQISKDKNKKIEF